MSSDWKKPNNKRVGNKSSGKFFGVKNTNENVKYTYTVEIGDNPPVETNAKMFVGKIEAKGHNGVLKLINRKVRFAAVDARDAVSPNTEFDFELKSVSVLEDGEWNEIFTANPDDVDLSVSSEEQACV